MHYFLIDKLEKCNLKLGLLKSIDNGSKTASSTTLLLLFFPVLMVGISQWKKHSSNFCLQARKKIINWQLLAKITFLLWEPINYTFCALMIFQGEKSVNGSLLKIRFLFLSYLSFVSPQESSKIPNQKCWSPQSEYARRYFL